VKHADSVLLVMGSGHQHFREYLLASAARTGPLWLFDPDEPTWQAPYVAGTTVLDVFDPECAVRAARQLAATTAVRGVYCYHEGVIVAAAHVCEALGLPGPSPQAVTAVRDKSVTRDRLTRAGLRQPRYAVVRDPEEAAQAAAVVGYPLVAKPRSLGASQGVVKVDYREQLAEALEISRSATQTGMTNHPEVLLEEYLTGPEISIDAAVHQGEYLPYLVAHKELGGEPYFEEAGHTVLGEEPLLADPALLEVLAQAHRAVGWTDGMTHTEVKLTPDGPVIVEINGRLGGDLIPHIGELANGIDSGAVAVAVSLGRRPDITPTAKHTVAIRFLCPPGSCTVTEVALPEPSPGSGLVESVALAGPGTRLLMPPEGYVARYGLLVARADSAEECRAVLDRAEAAAVFSWQE
jgi:biotin carboxylase